MKNKIKCNGNRKCGGRFNSLRWLYILWRPPKYNQITESIFVMFLHCSTPLTAHGWLILMSRNLTSNGICFMTWHSNVFGSVLTSLHIFISTIIIITLRIVPRCYSERHLAIHPLRFPHYGVRNDCLQNETERMKRRSEAALSFTISWVGGRDIKCSDEI
jgi:hypothetical protein